MNDLRKAAEQALKQLQRDDVYLGHRSKTRADAITALRQALAQPEQEPVDWEAVAADQAMTIAMMQIENKKEWVGLTEQDAHDAFNFTELVKQLSWEREPQEWCENFAAYCDAKLKEKNT